MTAKEAILNKIRDALADVPNTDPEVDTPITWTYGKALPTQDIIADFIEKVEDYGATVVRTDESELPKAIADAFATMGTERLVVPEGIPDDWTASLSGIELCADDTASGEGPLSHAELNDIDSVISTCAVAMADSGTIALDHSSGQGRRALTLLPDRHLCIVQEKQVVSDVPEGIATLKPALRDGLPVTWLSGGSATSDIELSRVEGVHGPRTLYVILVR